MRSDSRWLAVCACVAFGEACGLAVGDFAPMRVAVLLSASVALFVGYGANVRGWWALPLFLLGMALALSAYGRRANWLAAATVSGAPLELSLCVEGEAEVRGAERDGMRWVSFPTSSAGVRLRVICRVSKDDPLPQQGEVWRCAGWLDHRNSVADLRPRSLWVRGRGTFVRREREVAAQSPPLAFARIRRDLSRRMEIGLARAPEVVALNRAILLGERAELPADIRSVFIGAGTMHIFAISGLHVMVIARLFLCALTLCLIPGRLAGLVLVPLLWAYVYLIGMTASAVRAAAMASVYFAAPLFWRRPNALIAWSVTFLTVHLLNPLQLLNVGSALSFAVMLGILLCLRWLTTVSAGRWEMFCVSFAAWLAGTPIAAAVFGRVTPGGLLANLVLIPAAAASVVSSVIGIVASFVSSTLAAHVNNASALCTKTLVGISWTVSRLPGANFETGKWTVGACALWYCGAVFVAWVVSAWCAHLRRRPL